MRQFLNLIPTIFVTFSSCKFSAAQSDTAVIRTVRAYAKHLDSINNFDHPQDFGYRTLVADGITKQDDVVIGGFGIYTLSNAAGDTALRIEYHDNIDINIYKTYYFQNNKLIYATVELQDGRKNMKILYRKEEFYKGEKIIWTSTQQDKKANQYFEKINFSVLLCVGPGRCIRDKTRQ